MPSARTTPTILSLAVLALATRGTSQSINAPNPSAPQASAPTLHVDSRETIVDVTVTDPKGNPVHNLKESDFTILEDGKPVTPSSFAERRIDLAPAAPPATPQKLPPNTYTNVAPPAPPNRPLNLLLLDELNTPLADQQIVVKRMLEYLKTIPPGTQMAVLRLTGNLRILQGFTSNAALIRAALTGKHAIAWPSPVDDPESSVIYDPSKPITLDSTPPSRPGQPPDPPNNPANGTSEVEGNRSALQGQYTVSALRQIARFAANLPGRKNLIWFSGAFPDQFPPVQDHGAFPPPCKLCGEYLPGGVYDLTSDLKSAADLLTRSHVAVFPIDARGLKVPDQEGKGLSGFSNRDLMRMAEHGTMDDIADATGGHAFYNTNGFAEAVQQAITAGSNYYTLTYVPTKAPDTRFRKITVKVAQPGVKLTYRNGYYATAPNTSPSGAKLHPIPQPTALQLALTHGAPSFTEVLFNAEVTHAAAPDAILPADNQRSSPQMKPPYLNYTITYTTDVHTLDFTKSANGTYSADFEFVATIFNSDGDPLNSTTREVQPLIPEATYQSMVRDGAISHQDIAVPAKGDYTIRLTVHDLNSDRSGTLELPIPLPQK